MWPNTVMHEFLEMLATVFAVLFPCSSFQQPLLWGVPSFLLQQPIPVSYKEVDVVMIMWSLKFANSATTLAYPLISLCYFFVLFSCYLGHMTVMCLLFCLQLTPEGIVTWLQLLLTWPATRQKHNTHNCCIIYMYMHMQAYSSKYYALIS